MLENILDGLKINASNDDFDSRRNHERRTMDSCVAVIDGKAYPIKDWSNGGVLLVGDDRVFSMHDTKEIILKFKLADRVIDVTHTGTILRKGNNEFALQFSPLTNSVGSQFRMVIDDANARAFADSQI